MREQRKTNLEIKKVEMKKNLEAEVKVDLKKDKEVDLEAGVEVDLETGVDVGVEVLMMLVEETEKASILQFL